MDNCGRLFRLQVMKMSYVTHSGANEPDGGTYATVPRRLPIARQNLFRHFYFSDFFVDSHLFQSPETRYYFNDVRPVLVSFLCFDFAGEYINRRLILD
jgi:hypothetical protein